MGAEPYVTVWTPDGFKAVPQSEAHRYPPDPNAHTHRHVVSTDEQVARALVAAWKGVLEEQQSSESTLLQRLMPGQYVPSERAVRDMAVLDGFIEKFKALCDEHGVYVHAPEGAFFMRGVATSDIDRIYDEEY